MVSKHKTFKNSKKRLSNRKGYTLMQLIVIIAIIAILIGLTSFGISAFAKQAYMTEVNDVSKTVFMGFQSALSRIKSEGLTNEVFNRNYLTDDINKIGDASAGEYYFVLVPKKVVEGYTADGVEVPGVVDANGNPLTGDELQTVKENLVYIRLNKGTEGVSRNKSEQKLLDILDSYIQDKNILLGYDVLVEFNIKTMTVRAVFATRKSPKPLSYYSEEVSKTLPEYAHQLEERNNVLIRKTYALRDKEQGYYGFGSAGYDETIIKLQKPQVNIYNDDILAVEWFEPENISGSAVNESVLNNLKYNLKVVNSVNTDKVYYEINNISAFSKDYSYNATYVNNLEAPVPRYDLFNKDKINDITKPEYTRRNFEVKELKGDSLVSVTKDLRLSYYRGDSDSKPGAYRLVLDMIDSNPESSALSITKNFPAIPIDEEFKVIVQLKPEGEGFVTDEEISSVNTNALFSARVYSTVYKDGKVPKSTSNVNKKENVWFEITHARHLNNVRYVTGYNDFSDNKAMNGEARQFVLRGDVDWSVQKIGYNALIKTHKLVTANTKNYSSAVSDYAKELRYFAPIETSDKFGANSGTVTGFKGIFKSDYDVTAAVTDSKYPINHRSINYLRLSELQADNHAPKENGTNVGLFSVMDNGAVAESITFNGVSAVGKSNVGVLAGTFSGEASGIVVKENKEKIIIGKNVEDGALIVAGTPVITPDKISNANSVVGKDSGSANIGGVVGLVTGKTVSGTNEKVNLTDINNGIVEASGAGTKGITVKSDNKTAGGIIGFAQLSGKADLAIQSMKNAGAVTAASDYAGGIIGSVEFIGDSNFDLDGAKNSGQIIAEKSYAGGIIGNLNNSGKKAVITGLYNYQSVLAKVDYAGGIVGRMSLNAGSNSASNLLTISTNIGGVKANADYAGGIVGLVENNGFKTSVENLENKSAVNSSNFAGGAFGAIRNSDTAAEVVVNKIDNNGKVSASAKNAGGIVGYTENAGNKIEYKALINHVEVKAKEFSGGIAGNVVNGGSISNQINFNDSQNNGNVVATSASANSGVAGGIIGIAENRGGSNSAISVFDAENYGAVKSYSDVAGGIIGSSNRDSNVAKSSVKVENAVNSGEIKTDKNFSGGIFGIVGVNTTLDKSNNSGIIFAGNDYAGGIAGLSVNKVTMSNIYNDGVAVKAYHSYAGGIVGAISSEAKVFGGASATVQSTRIQNTKKGFYDKKTDVKYANIAAVLAGESYAGGIVGHIEASEDNNDTLLNLTNGVNAKRYKLNNQGAAIILNPGDSDYHNSPTGIRAKNYAGGIAGEIADDKNDILEYADDFLNAYVIVGKTANQSRYTNVAPVKADVSFAGGIAGRSKSTLSNVFNAGESVVSGKSFAGGIVGEMTFETWKDDAGVRYNNESVLKRMFALSENGAKVYSNSAVVQTNGSNHADGFAGGIAGNLENGVVKNAFNGGAVTSAGINAGGIVGHGDTVEITTEGTYVEKMIAVNSLFSNNSIIKANVANAGGIAGKIETGATKRSVIENVINGGELVEAVSGLGSDGVNAGGIAGYAVKTDIGYTDQKFVKSMIEKSRAFTNMANVRVRGSKNYDGNAGGIVGKGKDVTIVDVLNHGGTVSATASRNAGGIYGSSVDSSVTHSNLAKNGVIAEMMRAGAKINSVDKSAHKAVGFTNTADILARHGNAGGIAGYAQGSLINDVFNRGDVTAGAEMGKLVHTNFSKTNSEDYHKSVNDTDADNAGGLVGYALNGTVIQNTDAEIIRKNILSAGVMNSYADVTALTNAGGLVGKIEGTDSEVTDVYTGSVSARNNHSGIEAGTKDRRTYALYDAGGVAGYIKEARLIYDPANVIHSIKLGRYTNSLYVKAEANNAGGIIGKAEGVFATGDLYNVADVDAGWNNAGGVFGYAQHGKYANSDNVVDAMLDRKGSFVTNSGKVTASAFNAGGIFGVADKLAGLDGADSDNLLNAFNNGTIAVNRTSNNGNNAGGVVGLAKEIKLSYSVTIVAKNGKPGTDIFVLTNGANVTAANSNAGGVFGKSKVYTNVTDAFNGGENFLIKAGVNNAGGFIGLSETDATSTRVSKVEYSEVFRKRIREHRDYAYSNATKIFAGNDNAGGIVGFAKNDAANDSSIRFYFEDAYNEAKVEAGNDNAGGIIGQGQFVGSRYQTIVPTSYGKNRYTNTMDATNKDYSFDSITAGRNNAGGIGGQLADSEIKDVFNLGSVKAKGTRAGGIIGYSKDTYLGVSTAENTAEADLGTIRTFQINRLGYKDEDGVWHEPTLSTRGEYSTFDVAFTDIHKRIDPYIIDDGTGVKKPLGMTVNEGRVVSYYNDAGGAIGHMEGGRTERLYFLRGSVIAQQNAGGIVGSSTKKAILRQVTRLDGVCVKHKVDASRDIDIAYADYDSTDTTNDIILGTNNNAKTKEYAGVSQGSELFDFGSTNVGGIVGYAVGNSEIVDVRNFTVIEGRQYVGGVVGATEGISPTSSNASNGVSITLAHNMKPVTGVRVTKEDISGNTVVVDKKENDGSYIGGVLGGTYGDLNGKGIFITMAKNDPLITDDFSALETVSVVATGNANLTKDKFTPGGNADTAITGLKYVGGISGAGGHITGGVNTGIILGTRVIGGVAGHAYKIDSAFNTARVLGQNMLLYSGPDNFTPQNSTFVGGVAGEVGYIQPANGLSPARESDSYIRSSYNTGNIVQGQSIIGGVVGYAAGEVSKVYNSAYVSPTPYDGRDIVESQMNNGEGGYSPLDNDIEDKGSQVGGLIGVLAQNDERHIILKDSYNVGRVTISTNGGGLIGSLESTANNLKVYLRVFNSYYLSDDSIRFYDTYTGFNSIKFNHTIKPISFLKEGTAESPDGDMNLFVEKVWAESDTGYPINPNNVTSNRVPLSDYGVRTFKGLMVDGAEFGSHGTGWSLSGGSQGKGVELTKDFLNDGVTLPSQLPTVTGFIGNVASASNEVGAPKIDNTAVKFPKTDSFIAGLDFEFLQQDLMGDDNDAEKLSTVNLGSYFSGSVYGTMENGAKNEIPDNNQRFEFKNNARVVNSFRAWNTIISKNLEVTVGYQGIDSSKKDVKFQEEIVGGVNRESVTVDRVETGEKITFTAKMPNNINPSQIDYQVFDGHSRAYYDYKNEYFIIMPALKTPLKIYSFVHERDIPTEELSNIQFRKVVINGENYYFYMSDEDADTSIYKDDGSGNTVLTHYGKIFKSIKVVDSAALAGYIEVSIEIDTVEMDRNYQAPKSGYFTFEAEVYDDSVSGNLDTSSHLKPYQVVSRMFSMHFSNDEMYSMHNMDAFEALKDSYFDEISDLITEVPVPIKTNTAALGSTRLRLENDPAGRTMNATTGNTDVHVIDVENALEIRDERHLYNINKNAKLASAGSSQKLTYLSKHFQLKNDIEMTPNNLGYNDLIIGKSYDHYYRFTGSFDGEGHAIKGFMIDKYEYPNKDHDNNGTWDVRLSAYEHGLFYEASGGVIKNLTLAESNIVAANVGAIAFNVSNGRTLSADDPDNQFYENLEPQLPIERGYDAKIYNCTVDKTVNLFGNNVGGYTFQTSRRFNNREDSANKDMKNAATYTNVAFNGKINAHEDGILSLLPAKSAENAKTRVSNSAISAGILCLAKGVPNANDILYQYVENPIGYATRVDVNGATTSTDAYIYGKISASGIVGIVKDDYKLIEEITGLELELSQQRADIRKSINNAFVVSKHQASGISQGARGDVLNLMSQTNIFSSYNNGTVQTPSNSGGGLSSGIGHYLNIVRNSANNGAVYGKIASGITAYGIENTKISMSANHGMVKAYQIAGGINAAPTRYNGDKTEVLKKIKVKLNNCYNTGTVVVTTNIDNGDVWDTNSYAGGIIGYAPAAEHRLDSAEVSASNITLDIYNDDDGNVYRYKTIITNCYNVGSVYYEKEDEGAVNDPARRSMNNRYLGGIVGGGMNRYSTIENSFSLSDPELRVTAKNDDIPKCTIVMIDGNGKLETGFETVTYNTLPEAIGFNYQLDAVGDAAYMGNVSSMTYSQMRHLENYMTFGKIKKGYGENSETEVAEWITTNAEHQLENAYPFPVIQFITSDIVDESNYIQYGMAEDPDNEGVYIERFPDKAEMQLNDLDVHFNVAFNLELNDAFQLNEPAITMDTDGVHKKTVTAVPVGLEYRKIGTLGTDDAKSEYTFNLPAGLTGNFELTVYDGDPFGVYAPKEIRKYHVINGVLSSGGRLHSEKSTTEVELGYFNPANVAYDGSSITIKDEEELGYYMPIHGFYTAVVRQFTSQVVDIDYTEKVEVNRTQVSDRFQIHFAGNKEGTAPAVESNASAQSKLGTKDMPLYVVDQYGILGLTTSGIAKQATVDKFYKQSSDIIVTLPFYSIFEFNGFYDGAIDSTSSYDGTLPVNSRNHTLKFRNDEFGFVSYFRTDISSQHIATIKNVNFDVVATDGDYLSKPGKFAEATNFNANFGLVADYMDYAAIEGVTTSGEINILALGAVFGSKTVNSGFTDDFKANFAGVVGSARNSTITNTKNNAGIGIKTATTLKLSNGGDIIPNYPVIAPENIHVSGIIGSAIKTNFIYGNTPVADGKVVLDGLANNGAITARAQTGGSLPSPDPETGEIPKVPVSDGSAFASGIVYKVGDGVSLTNSFNGGQINTYDGTSSGVVGILEGGTVEKVYNSGKIFSYEGGTAAGLIGEGRSGNFKQAYNAGMIIALEGKRAALVGNGKYTNNKFVVTYTPSVPEVPAVLNPDGTVQTPAIPAVDAEINPPIKDYGNNPPTVIPREDRVPEAAYTTELNMESVYYLKDSKLFWTDSYFYERNDAGELLDENGNPVDKEILMGFGSVPGNTWAFKNGKEKLSFYDYKESRGSNPREYTRYNSEIIDPLAITYDQLTDTDELLALGFTVDFASPTGVSGSAWDKEGWFIDENAFEDKTMGNPLVDETPDDFNLDELNDDLYPFPQFKSYHHINRGHADFPEFFGHGSEVQARPETKYIAYQTEETFQDTLEMDLGDSKGLSKVDIVIQQGLPKLDKDPDGYYLVEPDLIIEIERVYLYNDIDEDDIARAGDNPAYSDIIENPKTGTGYYYRITPIHIPMKMIDGDVNSGTVGVYPAKFVLSDAGGDYEAKDGRFKVILNNDVLDKLNESDIDGERFYSGTAIKYHFDANAAEDEKTDNYYSRFNPHFANAVSSDYTEAWNYGSQARPYEIATQRNLHNIALGNNLVDGGGVNISAYMKSHYIQTGDITLTDEKTFEPLDAPLISSKDGAAIHHENPLWMVGIGGESGFGGVYKGQGNTMIDTRTNTKAKPIEFSLFEHVTGEVGGFDYVMDYGTNNLYIKSTALIVGKNSGTVKDINVTANSTGFTVNAYNEGSFGLVVGRTYHNDLMSHVPEIKNINVDVVGVLPRTNGTASLGTVIGVVDGSANISEVESNLRMTSPLMTSYAQHNKDSITGGLIGNAIATEATNAVVNINDSVYKGEIDLVNVNGGKIGGIIGSSDNVMLNINATSVLTDKLSVKGITTNNGEYSVGGFIGRADHSNVSVISSAFDGLITIDYAGTGSFGGAVGSSNNGKLFLSGVKLGEKTPNARFTLISRQNVNRNIGGFVGSVNGKVSSGVSDSLVKLDSVSTDMAFVINMNTTATSSIGGFIGQISQANVSLENVNNNQDVVIAGVGNGDFGGIIGTVKDSPQVNMLKVFNGVVPDTASGVAPNVMDINSCRQVNAGGIIGNVVKTLDGTMAIDLTSTENRSNIAAGTLGADSNIGGIIGNVSGNSADSKTNITMNEVLNTGDIKVRAVTHSNVSGIVGSAVHAKLVTGNKTVNGEKGHVVNTGDIQINRYNASVPVNAGGLLGFGNAVDLEVKNFTNHGNIGVNESGDSGFGNIKVPGANTAATPTVFVGGLAGKVSGSAIDLRENYNSGHIASTAVNALVSGFIAEADLDPAKSHVIENNINAGKLTGTYPAGIVRKFNEAAMTKLSIKYNVNMGLMVAKVNGGAFDITANLSLPLGTDSASTVYTAKALIDWDVTAQGAMPTITRFYNVSLVDADKMANSIVKGDSLKSDALAGAKQLALEELQHLDKLKSLTGWTDISLATDSASTTFKVGPKSNNPDNDNYYVVWLSNNKYSYISEGIDYLTAYPKATLEPGASGSFDVKWQYDVRPADVAKVKGYQIYVSDALTGEVYKTYTAGANDSLQINIPSEDLLEMAFEIPDGVRRELNVTVVALWGEQQHHINSVKTHGISVVGVNKDQLLNFEVRWKSVVNNGDNYTFASDFNKTDNDIILYAKPDKALHAAISVKLLVDGAEVNDGILGVEPLGGDLYKVKLAPSVNANDYRNKIVVTATAIGNSAMSESFGYQFSRAFPELDYDESSWAELSGLTGWFDKTERTKVVFDDIIINPVGKQSNTVIKNVKLNGAEVTGGTDFKLLLTPDLGNDNSVVNVVEVTLVTDGNEHAVVTETFNFIRKAPQFRTARWNTLSSSTKINMVDGDKRYVNEDIKIDVAVRNTSDEIAVKLNGVIIAENVVNSSFDLNLMPTLAGGPEIENVLEVTIASKENPAAARTYTMRFVRETPKFESATWKQKGVDAVTNLTAGGSYHVSDNVVLDLRPEVATSVVEINGSVVPAGLNELVLPVGSTSVNITIRSKDNPAATETMTVVFNRKLPEFVDGSWKEVSSSGTAPIADTSETLHVKEDIIFNFVLESTRHEAVYLLNGGGATKLVSGNVLKLSGGINNLTVIVRSIDDNTILSRYTLVLDRAAPKLSDESYWTEGKAGANQGITDGGSYTVHNDIYLKLSPEVLSSDITYSATGGTTVVEGGFVRFNLKAGENKLVINVVSSTSTDLYQTVELTFVRVPDVDENSGWKRAGNNALNTFENDGSTIKVHHDITAVVIPDSVDSEVIVTVDNVIVTGSGAGVYPLNLKAGNNKVTVTVRAEEDHDVKTAYTINFERVFPEFEGILGWRTNETDGLEVFADGESIDVATNSIFIRAAKKHQSSTLVVKANGIEIASGSEALEDIYRVTLLPGEENTVTISLGFSDNESEKVIVVLTINHEVPSFSADTGWKAEGAAGEHTAFEASELPYLVNDDLEFVVKPVSALFEVKVELDGNSILPVNAITGEYKIALVDGIDQTTAQNVKITVFCKADNSIEKSIQADFIKNPELTIFNGWKNAIDGESKALMTAGDEEVTAVYLISESEITQEGAIVMINGEYVRLDSEGKLPLVAGENIVVISVDADTTLALTFTTPLDFSPSSFLGAGENLSGLPVKVI